MTWNIASTEHRASLEWNKFSSSSHRKCSLPNACQKWFPEDKTTSDKEWKEGQGGELTKG